MAGRGRQYIRGGESEAVHDWVKGMKPEVCFVVGLVSFSGTAGVRKKERQGHRGLEFQYFSFFTRRLELMFAFSSWPFSILNFI